MNFLLSFCSDFSKTSDLYIVCSSSTQEATKSFSSRDDRTNNCDKTVSFHKPCNALFNNWANQFTWDLHVCIEHEQTKDIHGRNIEEAQHEVLAPVSNSSDEHRRLAITNEDETPDRTRDFNVAGSNTTALLLNNTWSSPQLSISAFQQSILYMPRNNFSVSPMNSWQRKEMTVLLRMTTKFSGSVSSFCSRKQRERS